MSSNLGCFEEKYKSLLKNGMKFEDAELFDTPITAFGTVSMGGFKEVKLQLIADDIEIEEN